MEASDCFLIKFTKKKPNKLEIIYHFLSQKQYLFQKLNSPSFPLQHPYILEVLERFQSQSIPQLKNLIFCLSLLRCTVFLKVPKMPVA